MKGTISFLVENIEQVREYARVMGHGNASNLARLAVAQHMRRYPCKSRAAVLPKGNGGEETEDQGGENHVNSMGT
jgi:hypothetical protein